MQVLKGPPAPLQKTHQFSSNQGPIINTVHFYGDNGSDMWLNAIIFT